MKIADRSPFRADPATCPYCGNPALKLSQGGRSFLAERLAVPSPSAEEADFLPHACRGYLDRVVLGREPVSPGPADRDVADLAELGFLVGLGRRDFAPGGKCSIWSLGPKALDRLATTLELNEISPAVPLAGLDPREQEMVRRLALACLPFLIAAFAQPPPN